MLERVGVGGAFLVDDWAGVGPLHVLYPTVFRVVSNKESAVNDCYVWRGSGISWALSSRKSLSIKGVHLSGVGGGGGGVW